MTTQSRIWRGVQRVEKNLTKVKSHDRNVGGKKVHVKTCYRNK